jgi:hypothetical protein
MVCPLLPLCGDGRLRAFGSLCLAGIPFQDSTVSRGETKKERGRGRKLLTMAFGCWLPGISEGISRRCSAISGCAPRMGRGPPPCAMNMTGSSGMASGLVKLGRKEGMDGDMPNPATARGGFSYPGYPPCFGRVDEAMGPWVSNGRSKVTKQQGEGDRVGGGLRRLST